MRKKYSFFRLFILIIFSLIYISCSDDEIQIYESNSIETASLSVADDNSYIVVISKDPAHKNENATRVLENLQTELGIPDQAIGYKYKKVLTGFSAQLNVQKVRHLKNNPNVEMVVRDVQMEHTSFETGYQNYPTWGLDRIDQRDNLLDRVYSYNATGTGVTAYIVDSGINYSHEEFEGRARLGYDFVAELDPENTDPDQSLGEDCWGHGTHVAATVGGKTYGVAKEVDLVSVRVFGCEGLIPESRVLAAIEWITSNANRPAVINMSLGGPIRPEVEPFEIGLRNSIATGLTYITSAGNNYADACNYTPARVEEAISVGASDINNGMAWFSNYGSCVDLFAPGVKITSASNEDNISTKTFNGTSMAAPHVTGVAALYYEKNNDAPPVQVFEAIKSNTSKGMVADVPAGTNDLLYSLWEETNSISPPGPDFNLEALVYKNKNRNRAALTWIPTEDQTVKILVDGRVFDYTENDGLFFYNSGGKTPDSFQVCEVNYDNCSAIAVSQIVNDPLLLPNEDPQANFYYQVNGLQIKFNDKSLDFDGEIVAWEWSFGDGNTSTLQNPIHTYSEEGMYLVNLTVFDDRNGSDSYIDYFFVEKLPEPEPVDLELTVQTVKRRGRTTAVLSWTPSGTSENIEIYTNNEMLLSPNDGDEEINLGKGSGTGSFKVCIPESTYCSNEVIVDF